MEGKTRNTLFWAGFLWIVLILLVGLLWRFISGGAVFAILSFSPAILFGLFLILLSSNKVLGPTKRFYKNNKILGVIVLIILFLALLFILPSFSPVLLYVLLFFLLYLGAWFVALKFPKIRPLLFSLTVWLNISALIFLTFFLFMTWQVGRTGNLGESFSLALLFASSFVYLLIPLAAILFFIMLTIGVILSVRNSEEG